jgi:hypothetical protein
MNEKERGKQMATKGKIRKLISLPSNIPRKETDALGKKQPLRV